jgi:transcriptional regulator with XRE-family HTH domain
MPENRLKEFRVKAGLTQTELSRKVRMCPQNISSIEHGRLAAWPKIRKALAKALKTTETELFGEVKNG